MKGNETSNKVCSINLLCCSSGSEDEGGDSSLTVNDCNRRGIAIVSIYRMKILSTSSSILTVSSLKNVCPVVV